MIVDNKIVSFSGDEHFLSNFYPCSIHYDKHVFPTSEHLFVYFKIKVEDRARFVDYLLSMTAGQVKRFGRNVDLIDGWDNMKVGVMRSVIYLKFNENRDLKEKLLATGSMDIEEGNTWGDKFWGVCPPGSSDGKNWLGKLLMELRNEYRFENIFIDEEL